MYRVFIGACVDSARFSAIYRALPTGEMAGVCRNTARYIAILRQSRYVVKFAKVAQCDDIKLDSRFVHIAPDGTLNVCLYCSYADYSDFGKDSYADYSDFGKDSYADYSD